MKTGPGFRAKAAEVMRLRILMKTGPGFRAKAAEVMRLRIESSFPEFCRPWIPSKSC
jgi:hypothetical protein